MGTSFALQGTSCDVDGACDATGGCAHHITGYVRFLQGGSLTISDGTDSTTVTTAGAFTLPGNVYSGDPFTIALSGSTPGQVCTARSGTGTGVVGNSSPNVSIVCTLTLNSTGHVVGGWTFNSTSFTPMPSFLFPPLAFSTDGGDTDVLITTDAGQFASGTAEIGLEVDGVVDLELRLPMPFTKNAKFVVTNSNGVAVNFTLAIRGVSTVPTESFGHLFVERQETAAPALGKTRQAAAPRGGRPAQQPA